MSTALNPTSAIDLDFALFVKNREDMSRTHYDGRTPDYCFSLDRKLRQRLAAIPGVQYAFKSFSSIILAIQKQMLSLQGVAVGPRQFPRIYSIAQDCAERLGIGIPQVYILYNPTMNAYSLATEETGAMVVLHSSLVEAMTDDELRFVIGHECGHIHNLHGIWSSVGVLLSNAFLQEMAKKFPGAGTALQLTTTAAGWFLNAWFRCSEVTADRAGLICSGDLDHARYGLAKLATGGRSDILKDVNLDEYVKQLESDQATPVRLWESQIDHPITSKRIAMVSIFRECETLYAWRPEMRSDKPALSKTASDAQCEQVARVFLRRGVK